MSIGRILFEVPYDLKKTFRNYEEISKKLTLLCIYFLQNIHLIIVFDNKLTINIRYSNL